MESLRDKWIAALRSGEYEQGQEYLNGEDGFCCLGVLADVAGGEWRTSPSGYCHLELKGASFFNVLPHSVLPSDQQQVCWSMNDVEKLSFHEIADYIEAHPEIDPKWPVGGAE